MEPQTHLAEKEECRALAAIVGCTGRSWSALIREALLGNDLIAALVVEEGSGSGR